MSNIKISVIIAFDNGTDLLKDALESLRLQSFTDFETIVVWDLAEKPDPSPKEEHPYKIKTTRDELRSLTGQYPGVKVFEIKKGGVAAARNEGIARATGEYIYFLDADDFLLPDTLEKLAAKAGETGADIIFGKNVKTKLGLLTVMREGTEEAEKDFNAANTEGVKAGAADAKAVNPLYDDAAENDGTGIRHVSVLNTLIKNNGDLPRFNEQLYYYSDVPFTAGLLTQARTAAAAGDAVYMKRTRSDAIRLPSLTQRKDPDKPEAFLESYKITKALLKEAAGRTDGEYNAVAFNGKDITPDGLEKTYTAWFCKYLCNSFLKGASPAGSRWKPSAVSAFTAEAKKTDRTVFPAFTKPERKVLKGFASGNVKKALRKARIVHFNLKKDGIFGSSSQWKLWVYRHFFLKLPIKSDLVLFESFLGKSYGGNARYIYEYMIGRNMPYKYVWILNDKKAPVPGKRKIVAPSSWRYMYYLARYRYYVNDMRQPAWYDKRPGSTFLETWHGTPLKKLVFDINEVRMAASGNYKNSFFKASRVWDYLVSDNTFSTEAFSTAFLFPKEKIIETGYPRNDILYTGNTPGNIARLKREIGIPEGKKTVLYAPTWRDDEYYEKGKYKFELALDLKLLREKLGDGYIILLRTHYFIADNLDLSGFPPDFVIDLSRYPEIADLYLVSDVCITDYSSVFFDFANLRRPMLFYVYDFEKYRDVLHGFYIDMEKELPGPLLYTSGQVADALLNLPAVEQEYKQSYDAFYNRFCNLDDGHAAERIVKKVFGGL